MKKILTDVGFYRHGNAFTVDLGLYKNKNSYTLYWHSADLEQNCQHVEVNLYQESSFIEGDLVQDRQEVRGVVIS